MMRCASDRLQRTDLKSPLQRMQLPSPLLVNSRVRAAWPRRMPYRDVNSHQTRSDSNGTASTSITTISPEAVLPLMRTLDQEKEESRNYRRVVFGFDEWRKHRSSDRYARHIFSTFNSRILTGLVPPLVSLTVFSVGLCAYETALQNHTLPSYLPTFLLSSPQPQALTSFALALLLVFRTNSAYARFDDARRIWGGILNKSRDMAALAVAAFPPEDKVGQEAVGRWTIAFARALAAHIQEGNDIEKQLKPHLQSSEMQMLLTTGVTRPIKCTAMMSEVIQRSNLAPWQRDRLQSGVTFFIDAAGGCERILKTPIPLSYTRHTSRFLLMWLATLPLGLWSSSGWTLVPITLVIAILLFGIEEIGVQIEEPFGILPLDAICSRIEIDVIAILKESNMTRKYVAELRGGEADAGDLVRTDDRKALAMR